MDDLPRLGYRKGSEPDTNTNTIPSLTSTRKLSISHMKRKLTPAKNRINSQKQLDCLKFTTCDDTYKTLNTDSISV